MKLLKNRCVVTGHHLHELPFHDEPHGEDSLKLQEKIRKQLVALLEEGVQTFYCGLELGVELWVGEILLNLKKDYPDLKIHIALASEERANDWGEEDRERYFDNVLPFCDTVETISSENNDKCMIFRNNYLSKRSDLFLVVWDGRELCDTAYLVSKAKNLKKDVLILGID